MCVCSSDEVLMFHWGAFELEWPNSLCKITKYYSGPLEVVYLLEGACFLA